MCQDNPEKMFSFVLQLKKKNEILMVYSDKSVIDARISTLKLMIENAESDKRFLTFDGGIMLDLKSIMAIYPLHIDNGLYEWQNNYIEYDGICVEFYRYDEKELLSISQEHKINCSQNIDGDVLAW